MSKKILSNSHRGIFSLFAIGMAAFFAVGLVVVFILINVGFNIINTEKEVVVGVVSEEDRHLMIAGKISGTANIQSNEVTITALPIRTASAGSVDVDPQNIDIFFELIQSQNNTITYDDIHVGNLYNKTYFSLTDAMVDAKEEGLIELNPIVDEQKPTTTTAFIYWVINLDFDQWVDYDELAVITIIYADSDRPSTGDHLLIQANKPDGYILKIERQMPNISNTVMNFGGKVKQP